MAMEVVTTGAGLAKFSGGVFVPTMGALHDGHAALVRQARRIAAPGEGVVVSIFVNPTQFGESEDFSRYPRTLDDDLENCRGCGADCVFVPSIGEVYPPGAGAGVERIPRVATEPLLEDAARPGHFAGVCQVVRRLFDLVRPSRAIFGEKDWQQLQVIRAMTEEDGREIEIVPGPTIREPDGLAMSSRNRFLSQEDRRRGLSLSRALIECRGAASPEEAEGVLRTVLGEAGIEPDYAVVRDARTLAPGSGREWDGSRPMRAVVAARVGPVRLLDNMAWG